MSNWTTITAGDLTGVKIAAIITTATARGWDADAAIADVTARLRAACSTGNALDADASKIPNSLKAIALRMVIRLAKNQIEYPLTEDEKAQRTEDASYLNRITDAKIRFEAPDDAGASEMQPNQAIETQQDGNSGNSREDLKGL